MSQGPTSASMYNFVNAQQCLAACGVVPKRILVGGCGIHCEDVKAWHRLLEGRAQFVGVDIVDEFYAGETIDHAVYISADIANLPIVSKNFDLAYTLATFEHVRPIREGWQQMLNLLRPGGVLWSVSSPLWMTPYGHHKGDQFQGHPWIHLRYPDIDSLTTHCQQAGIESRDEINIVEHIKYIFNDNYFNRYSSRVYCQEAEKLQGGKIIINDFDYLPASELEGSEDLLQMGFDRNDLLALTHRLMVVKE